MKNNFIIFCSLIMTIFSILSCTDDNKTINTTEFTLTATLPEGFEDPSISDIHQRQHRTCNQQHLLREQSNPDNPPGRHVPHQHGRRYPIQERG